MQAEGALNRFATIVGNRYLAGLNTVKNVKRSFAARSVLWIIGRKFITIKAFWNYETFRCS